MPTLTRLLAVSVILTSCSVGFDIPSDVAITCSSGACPEGLVCVASTGLCVSPTTACVQKVGAGYIPVADGNKCEASGVASGTGVCFSGACVQSACGDGTVEFGEECDDGNNVDTDACRNNCRVNVCGDGAVNTGVEECDDGNTRETDGCLPSCIANVCGDGILNVGVETCEDQNANENDGCAHCMITDWKVTDSFGFGPWRGDPHLLGLGQPQDVAVDAFGNVYVSTWTPFAVFRLEAGSQKMRLYVGNDSDSNDPPDISVPAGLRRLYFPEGIAVDRIGNLYVTESLGGRVIRVDAHTQAATVIAGLGGNYCNGTCGDNGPALYAQFAVPQSVAVDDSGRVYIADATQGRVRVIGTDGIITTLFSLSGLAAVAVDGFGVVYAVQNEPTGSTYQRIWRYSGGTLTVLAGTGAHCGSGACGDGGPATSATFNNLGDIFVTHDGTEVFVADKGDYRVRRIAAGTITTIAGNGTSCASSTCVDDATRLTTSFATVGGVFVTPNDDLYVVDSGRAHIKRSHLDTVDTPLTSIAGSAFGEPFYTGVGATSSGAVQKTFAIAVTPNGLLHFVPFPLRGVVRLDSQGDLYNLAPQGAMQTQSGIGATADNGIVFWDEDILRVREVAADGTITDLAADGSMFDTPFDVASAADGTVYVSDAAKLRIFRVRAGSVDVFAGTGASCAAQPCGDGGPASAATLTAPRSIAVADNGDIYFVDATHVRRVDATGTITSVVSNVPSDPIGPFGLALGTGATPDFYVIAQARLIHYSGGVGATLSCTTTCTSLVGDNISTFDMDTFQDVALGPDGSVYVAEYDNGPIYHIDASGRVDLVVSRAHSPGAGIFDVARLEQPSQVAAMADGRYLVADGSCLRSIDFAKRQVDVAMGISRPPASNGTPAAYWPEFAAAAGVVFDTSANPPAFFTSDGGSALQSGSQQIMRVVLNDVNDPRSWPVSVFAGVYTGPGANDGAVATARFNGPTGLDYDETSGTLYVADRDNHVIRAIKGGQVSTVAGNAGAMGGDPDLPGGVPALEASLTFPTAVLVDPSGGLFIADTGDSQVRRLDFARGVIEVVLGDGTSGTSGDGAPARALPITAPRSLALDSFGNLFVGSGATVRVVSAGGDGIVSGDDAVRTIYGATGRSDYPQSATSCVSGLSILPGDAEIVFADYCSGFFVRLARGAAAQ